MVRFATKATKPLEIVQELEFLRREYERHMHVHKMNTNRGTLETLVTVSAEVAENLIKVKWGRKLAKLPFLLKERKIRLLEAELNAPGQEIALVAKAHAVFADH